MSNDHGFGSASPSGNSMVDTAQEGEREWCLDCDRTGYIVINMKEFRDVLDYYHKRKRFGFHQLSDLKREWRLNGKTLICNCCEGLGYYYTSNH